jgi:hypothetical protein
MVKNNTIDIQNAASDAVRAISEAALKATSVIAQAAETAAKVVSNNAETQARIMTLPSLQETNDHNLLIKLDTKVDQIQADVTTLKNQGTLYVTQADHKAVCEIQQDHESRLRKDETNITRILTWGSAGIVILAIVEFIINKFL